MDAMTRYQNQAGLSGRAVQDTVSGGIHRALLYGGTRVAVKLAMQRGKNPADPQIIGMLKTFAVAATVGESMVDSPLLGIALGGAGDIAAVLAGAADGTNDYLEALAAANAKAAE